MRIRSSGSNPTHSRSNCWRQQVRQTSRSANGTIPPRPTLLWTRPIPSMGLGLSRTITTRSMWSDRARSRQPSCSAISGPQAPDSWLPSRRRSRTSHTRTTFASSIGGCSVLRPSGACAALKSEFESSGSRALGSRNRFAVLLRTDLVVICHRLVLTRARWGGADRRDDCVRVERLAEDLVRRCECSCEARTGSKRSCHRGRWQ